MNEDEKIFLQKVCNNCKEANGFCIKDDIYIGLCSINDKYELLDIWRKKYVSDN